MKQTIFIISVLTVLLSCSDKKKYPYDLKCDTKSEFIVRLDSITSPSTKMMQFFEYKFGNNPLAMFAMLNEASQRINIHNNNGEKIKELSLIEIDSALPKTTGFYFINDDSLLLYSYKARELRLVSCNNTFKTQLMFNLDSLSSPTTNSVDVEVTSKTPILYDNGMVYLTGRAMYYDIYGSQPKNVSTAIAFNINSKRVDQIPLFERAWKDRYWHFEQYFVNHTFLPKENTVIYSLAMKDSILRYSFLKHDQTKFPLTSDELGNEKRWFRSPI